MLYHGTAPLLVLEVDEANLDDKQVRVDFTTSTGGEFRKTGDDLIVAGNQIAIRFTQEELMRIPGGTTRVQARWIGADNVPGISNVGTVDIIAALTNDTIVYQEG